MAALTESMPTAVGELESSIGTRTKVLEWLDTHEHMASLVLALRIGDSQLRRISRCNEGPDAVTLEVDASVEEPLRRVRSIWGDLCRARHTTDGGFQELRALHSCVVTGRVDDLKRLVESTIASEFDSPIVGYLYSDWISTPESARFLLPPHMQENHEVWKILMSVGDECYQLGRSGERQEKIRSILNSPAFRESISSAWSSSGGKRPPAAAANESLRFLAAFESEYDYLRSIGIGEPERWGRQFGNGQRVCVIDSGAYECHPMLQGQVKNYVRFNMYGHQKDTYACRDEACHGTKIAAWIVGRPARVEELCGVEQGVLRLGIAPGAKVIVVSALNGAMMYETGTIRQAMKALDWAARNRATNRYECVVFAAEFLDIDREGAATLDRQLALMKSQGLVPILPAGNRGMDSVPMGTEGTYVGALDANGSRTDYSGRRVDIWARGEGLCAHPLTPMLNGALVGEYGGTSLATAVVAGAVAGVAGAAGVPAKIALEAILKTSDGGDLNIEAALAALGV